MAVHFCDVGVVEMLKFNLYYDESESDVAVDGFIENAIECLY